MWGVGGFRVLRVRVLGDGEFGLYEKRDLGLKGLGRYRLRAWLRGLGISRLSSGLYEGSI